MPTPQAPIPMGFILPQKGKGTSCGVTHIPALKTLLVLYDHFYTDIRYLASMK